MDRIQVPDWQDTDYDMLCAAAHVVAFDLDGTLAVSRRPMLPEVTERFEALTRLIDVAVISGGSRALVTSQVLDVLGEDADRSHLHLMPTSGTSYYRWTGSQWTTVYEHRLNAEERRAAKASIERRAKEVDAWSEQVWGQRFEDRGGQFTYSALGQDAPVDAKRVWDPDNTRKQALAEAVRRDLPSLTVRAAGLTSVDVSAGGVDKAYAVRELAGRLGIDVENIVFVGDRMEPGGNDYPAAEAGAMPVRVSCPEDTVLLCDRLLERLSLS